MGCSRPGGVGSWAVQLAKAHWGAYVVATAGPKNQSFLTQVGRVSPRSDALQGWLCCTKCQLQHFDVHDLVVNVLARLTVHALHVAAEHADWMRHAAVQAACLVWKLWWTANMRLAAHRKGVGILEQMTQDTQIFSSAFVHAHHAVVHTIKVAEWVLLVASSGNFDGIASPNLSTKIYIHRS